MDSYWDRWDIVTHIMLTIQIGMPARVRPNTPGFAESAGILSLGDTGRGTRH